MAISSVAAQLTEAHRLAQARIGAMTVARMHDVWPLLDPNDLDATFQRWLRAAAPVVQGQRTMSAHLAGEYFTTFRALELGDGVTPVVPVLAEQVTAQQLATSLLVTGPVSIKANMARSMDLQLATDIAEAGSARAAMRQALDGGRETLTQATNVDPAARGWARVTSGSACAFCEMLAERGGVYTADSGDFQSHDGCACGVEPAY